MSKLESGQAKVLPLEIKTSLPCLYSSVLLWTILRFK